MLHTSEPANTMIVARTLAFLFAAIFLQGCTGDEASDRSPPPNAKLAVPPQGTESLPGNRNFLILIADDLGIDKVGVYNEHPNAGPTPNIDQMAADGVLFRNAWSNPSCSPTRASLLTGTHAHRHGLGTALHKWDKAEVGLDPETLNMARYFSSTHATAALGKWHLSGLGRDGARAMYEHPNTIGFEHFAGALANPFRDPEAHPTSNLPNFKRGDYFVWTKLVNGKMHQDTQVYLSRATADDTITLMQSLPEPWFIWTAFNAPHNPMHTPPAALYDLTSPIPDNPTTAEQHRLISEALDIEIGRIRAAMTPQQVANTTIIFLSDNGSQGHATEPPWYANRAKSTVYEGGANVPFIVVTPETPVEHRGKESQALVHVVDVFATLAEINGDVATGITPDSLSFLDSLRDPAKPARERMYTERFVPNGGPPYRMYLQAVRTDRMKLVRIHCTRLELYDLDTDPFEQTNLLADGMSESEQGWVDSLLETLSSHTACSVETRIQAKA